MRTRRLLVAAMLCTLSAGALAQQVLKPVFTDPPVDTAHPAAITVLHIPSHGVLINGLIYQPSGPGPHPTLIICATAYREMKKTLTLLRLCAVRDGMPFLSITAAHGAAQEFFASRKLWRTPLISGILGSLLREMSGIGALSARVVFD